jgi:anti-sigma regulatory factor (Ser/Thr protein kinase)
MEVIAPSRPLSIDDGSQVSEARRTATQLAERLGFDATGAGNVALVVTEIGTNILKHGGAGQILFTPLRRDGVRGIEIVGIDRGKGIADVERSLRDGYSTAGSAGTGLGAIRRLSAGFEVFSAAGQGTAVLARLWATSLPSPLTAPRVVIGFAGAAYAGEAVSGDAWAVAEHKGRTMLLLVDGLGHGLVAADAAREAVRLFHDNVGHAPAVIVQALHDGLRSTRGAAVAVTEIAPDRGVVKYAGVGNICAAIVTPTSRRHLVSHNGTAGHAVRRIDEFSYSWPKDAVLVKHTDGLSTHWDFDRYPGLLMRSPALIAAVLYRDFNRGRDDVSVLTATEARG